MKIFNSAAELRMELDSRRHENSSIGLVPTMGNLHQGHLRLVDEAVSTCDYVVSTIFVNPLQFGPQEDLQSYPRTFEQDQIKLTEAGCHCLYAPSVEEVFGKELKSQTQLHIPGLSEKLCGKSRPGHFDGVATVVCKLFNSVNPNIAFFGLKDYQQFLIIQKMTSDLGFDINLVGVEIVRDKTGLALSSRNNYLSEDELIKAKTLYSCLTEAATRIEGGEKDFALLEQQALASIEAAGLTPDYFSIAHAQTLDSAQSIDRELALLAAAYLGSTRLIDNIRIQL
ncbi:MAG: pantoate--beta-alanine ligase [Pseudomonadales bacterium]|nr:pantoate--beta-alanine ligase [Pseudomonadales bacterium]